MRRRRLKAAEIVNKRREADTLIAGGRTVVQARRQIGAIEQTYCRWREEQKRPTAAFPRISKKRR